MKKFALGVGVAIATFGVFGCGSSDSSTGGPSTTDSGTGGASPSTGGQGNSSGAPASGGSSSGGASSGGAKNTGGASLGTGGTSTAGAPNTGGSGEPPDGGDSGVNDGGPASDGSTQTGSTVSSVTPQYATVRQGQASFTITVTGTGLTGARGFDLQGLTIVQVQPGATDTGFTLLVTAPHGAALGPKDLSFTAGGEKQTKTGVVTVTPVTASPSGNDATNSGSADSPFRSFKKAVSAAAGTDTVELMDGTYDAAHGEDWQETLPDGITLEGQSPNAILSGPADQGSATSATGLAFAGAAKVQKLTVSYFADGALVSGSGEVDLTDVQLVKNTSNGLEIGGAAAVKVSGTSTISNNGAQGVRFDDIGATLDLNGVAIDANKQSGIDVNSASGTISITGGEINSNLMGALFYSVNSTADPLTLTMDRTKVWNNGYYTLYLAFGHVVMTMNDVSLKGSIDFTPKTNTSSSLTVTASTFAPPDSSAPAGTQNSFGILFSGDALDVENTTIGGFTAAAISQSSGLATLRGTTITVTSGGQYGYYITGGKLDLGTQTTPGNDAFVAPADASHYALYDGRAPAQAIDPITANNTTFNGDLPASGTTVTGAKSVNGEYDIAQTGNQIVFY